MDWRVLVVPVFAMSIAACSPFGGGAFACSDNSQCGATGVCSAGFCAFADPSCSSGERYGGASGPMSNQCVGGSTPTMDSGAPDSEVPLGVDAKQFLDAPGPFCYGVGLAMACFAAAPTGTVALTSAIDTDASPMCSTTVMGNPPWCVIAGAEINVSGTVVATGGKPLVLVAVDKIDVSGTLSAASTRTGGEVIGASADFATCDHGTAPKNNDSGGGAGGSFGGAGGNGGDGPTANTHGVAGGTQVPAALRGGCPGQDGDGTGGKAGHGGGALALIADGSITVEGAINASGEAGAGGASGNPNGGGGGGAGGLITLDSPTVTASGQVFTNGGGGAEGGSKNPNDQGADGNDPTVLGAAASDNHANAGNGGAGGFGTTPAGNGAALAGNAGGGGGGGVGVIKVYRATAISGGQVSPPPS